MGWEFGTESDRLENADDRGSLLAGRRLSRREGLRWDITLSGLGQGRLDGEKSLNGGRRGQAADHSPPADHLLWWLLWCFQNGTPPRVTW